MNSNLFRLNWSDVGGAILSGVVVAVLGYLGTLTDILQADPNAILNTAVLAAVASLLKALGVDADGKLFGAVKVR